MSLILDAGIHPEFPASVRACLSCAFVHALGCFNSNIFKLPPGTWKAKHVDGTDLFSHM